MAGDGKHARELIAEADGWVNADLVARHAMSALDTIRRLRNALEAALPGDDAWEAR